jgi:hypothetical protein
MNPSAESPQQVRLSLLFPPALEEIVTDALLADPALPGFVLLHAEGHEGDFTTASLHEQIRGHVERRMLSMIIGREHVDDLLATLRERIASHELRWWIEPVIASGSLT